MNNITEFKIKELVEELKKREAVKTIIIDPHEKYEINAGRTQRNDAGPVNIIIVYD